MNANFNINRCFLLVAKHWVEHRKRYLISLAAIGGLMLIWYVFAFFMSGTVRQIPLEFQLQTYYFGLFLTGWLFASQIFKELASKTKGTNYLTLPASHFEKWLCALFYAVVLFFISYTLVFYVVDTALVNITNNYAFKRAASMGEKFVAQEVINVFRVSDPEESGGTNYYLFFLLAYFATQSVFILGSIYFSKLSFIKTICIGVACWFLLFLLIDSVLMPMLPQGGFINSLNVYRLSDHDMNQEIHLPAWVHVLLISILKYAFAPLFWIVAYFRLKEKEI